MNRHLFGGVLITVAMVVFSLIGPFIRYVKLPPHVIIFYTSTLTAVVLLLYFACTRTTQSLHVRSHRWWLGLSALFILGNVYAYYRAFALTTMANSVLTHYSAPIFAALFAPLLLKEKLERITVAALVISMAGLLLIASNGLEISNRHVVGISYGAASGLFYGISILISKKLVQHYRPLVIIFYQCVINVVVLVPAVWLSAWVLTPVQAGLLTAYALLVGLGGVFLYLHGLQYVQAQHAGILAYSEPVIVVLIGMLFYKEIPTLRILAGGAFIVYSGYLVLKAEAGRNSLP